MPDSSGTLNYIVAATPRSGSTLLCELLKGSGVAGRPAEDFQALRETSRSRQPRQYFTGVDRPFVQRLAPTDPGSPEPDGSFAATLAASRASATTPNGVYGTKVMWSYFGDLEHRLRTLPGLASASLEDALESTFPGLKFLQIRRSDKVAQAISLWTAVQTLTWRDEGKTGDEPEVFYDFAGIDHLVQLQTSHEDAWSEWLAARDFPVRVVQYEDLAEDPQAQVRAVIQWLGVPGGDAAHVPAPKMRKQSNGRSAEWARRYRADLAAREGSPAT